MEPDYYEVLGVSPLSDHETIKKRYRQMVRENHPDVAADKSTAHDRIQAIMEAWAVLSQPRSRADYDERRRRLAVQDVAAQDAGPADLHILGRKRERVEAVMGGGRPGRAVNPRTRLLTMVFEAARLYHDEGRVEDAMRLCNNVLRAEPTNAEAAVLLADIHASQNRKDAAMGLYERALRLQPSNALYRQKYEALRHQQGGPDAPAPQRPAEAASAPNPAPADVAPSSEAATSPSDPGSAEERARRASIFQRLRARRSR
jgi:curved DNA-binding protein CbpA